MKFIFIVILVTTASIISCSQNNSKKLLNANSPDFVKTTDTTGLIIEQEMVTVEGGTFAMGGNEENNKPIHNVTLSSFRIARYETTQAQWEKVMGKNSASNPGCADCPVQSISWEMVQTFITELNRLSGKRYRLPTEAEWEYTARGGIKSENFEFAGSNDIKSVAWTSLDSGLNPHPVGQKKPNELGLYDMSGNAWEWCNDWYDENYYRKSPGDNPTGPATRPPDKKNDEGLISPLRVVRGGNSGNGPAYSRVASRPKYRLGYHSIGFRLASSS